MNIGGTRLAGVTHSAIRKGAILVSIIRRKLSLRKGESMNDIQTIKNCLQKTLKLELTDEQPNDSDLSDVSLIQ